MQYRPFILIVLDGWGHREDIKDNAIAQALTPFYDSLMNKYPHTLLDASQESVGLPAGQMGNSEIGHMTIGAGKIIDTDLVNIAKAIRSGEYGKNPAFVDLFEHVKKHESTLHVMGLLSAGGVHAHEDHLHEFLKEAKKAGIMKVVVHAFTDGRDTPPQSAAENLRKLENVIADLGVGFIATATGRFYAMDRDNNWDRIAKFENLVFGSNGGDSVNSGVRVVSGKKPSEIFEEIYAQGELDEHVKPILFLDENEKSYPVQDYDGIFFFNFRSDRARQLSKKIAEYAKTKDLFFVTMTEYDPEIGSVVAYPQSKIETTLAAEISKAGLSQSHVAETEKYAHATYFLNGGREQPHPNEKHILVESRKDVLTHDLAPRMRAEQIADKVIEQIDAGADFIFINFANADMVGHTANVPAIIEAVQEVDSQLKRVAEAVLARGGALFITADHGNAELNIDPETREKHTAHTTNFVPAIITVPELDLREGTLADVAPTVLELMGLQKPDAMTGSSLIKK